MILPVGVDVRPRRPPVGNYLLLALNVLIFAYTDMLGGAAGQHLKSLGVLHAAVPDLAQYLTYQFLHGDFWHLFGNMLFLWIFGNAVCDRMGSFCYVLFYLAGGVFAGVTFAAFNDNAILGASGAIAAVTTAFLALFPRVHVTLLVWVVVFGGFYQVHALWVITLKIVLWDNVVAPMLEQSAVSNVAHSAHLGGYGFGFLVALGMLGVRALPRNPFDFPSLWSRWRAGGFGPPAPPQARPVTVRELDSRPLSPLSLTPVERLRAAVLERLQAGDHAGAAEGYLQLIEADPHQVLPRQAQLDIASYFAQMQRHAPAAAAYEAFLAAHPAAPDAAQVHLLLGLIYARYLEQFEPAAQHLRAALAGLASPDQRTLAENELRRLLGRRSESDPTA